MKIDNLLYRYFLFIFCFNLYQLSFKVLKLQICNQRKPHPTNRQFYKSNKKIIIFLNFFLIFSLFYIRFLLKTWNCNFIIKENLIRQICVLTENCTNQTKKQIFLINFFILFYISILLKVLKTVNLLLKITSSDKFVWKWKILQMKLQKT